MGDIWTGPAMWIFLAIFFVAILIITLYIFKKEEQKIKKLEEQGDSTQDELQRSLEYEQQSLTSNIPVLTWIYVISIGLSLLALVIYMVKF